jgi:hypothetical protein
MSAYSVLASFSHKPPLGCPISERSGMTIIRRKVTRNFTVLANDCFQDERLGGEDLGALTYLLSRPNDWQVRPPSFSRRMRWGCDKTYAVLNTLAAFGYIERRQQRDPKTGAFQAVEYIVYDEPVGAPLPENPEAATEPSPALPIPANTKAAKKPNIESKKISPLAPQRIGEGSSDGLSDVGRRPSLPARALR